MPPEIPPGQQLMSPDAVCTRRPFSVMVKPVGSHCNLRCSYCYYLPVPSAGVPRISDEQLERFISQYLSVSSGPEVSFVWHGGEPTLAGLDFYRRVVELQKKYLPKGWVCWNNLQTNAVLLDDEWCAFLAQHRFDVGLSIDGLPEIHDQYRLSAQGVGSYQVAADTIRRLQAYGVQPDLLCTVTAATAAEPLAVYRNLRAFGTGWIQFIPIVDQPRFGKPTPGSISGAEYGRFLCAVFDDWVLHDLGRVDVQLFAEVMRVLAGGEAGLCWLAPTCGRALIVEADGGVYSCDHFVMPEHRLGDIATAQLVDLANSPAQLRFGENKRDALAERCRACEWLPFCNGGCPKDRLIGGAEPGLNQLCDGLAVFFAHAIPALKHVVTLTKRGETPEAIMASLQVHARSVWQGIGRNDLCPCGSGQKAKYCCWSSRP